MSRVNRIIPNIVAKSLYPKESTVYVSIYMCVYGGRVLGRVKQFLKKKKKTPKKAMM